MYARVLTGRMHRLLPEVVARIGRAYGAGTRCLLIVPEQYTLQAETEIVERLRLPGYFDIDVLSPSRLRDRVFERAGQPQRVRIDERGKCMVLSAALEDLQDDLLFYRGAGGRAGFVQRLSALVADFKRGGLSPQDVAQLAGRTDGMLAMKLEDAGRVFAAYEARLAGSFVDGEDVQRELLARIKANLRRTTMLSAPAAEDNSMSAGGGITINTDSFQVRKNGVPIDLTQREYELLTFLASHPGKVFSRVDLMEQVWNYGYVGDDARTVDVTVRRLREKIEDNPASPVYILTRRGVGYYFSAQA